MPLTRSPYRRSAPVALLVALMIPVLAACGGAPATNAPAATGETAPTTAAGAPTVAAAPTTAAAEPTAAATAAAAEPTAAAGEPTAAATSAPALSNGSMTEANGLSVASVTSCDKPYVGLIKNYPVSIGLLQPLQTGYYVLIST